MRHTNSPRTELAALSDNIAWLIQDIDKLDGHRRNMLEELKVLHDITFFYHERHPELRAAGLADDKEDDNTGYTRQHDTKDIPDELPKEALEHSKSDLEDETTATKK